MLKYNTLSTANLPDPLPEAYAAATAAIKAHFAAGHREHPFNCGFAWVVIPTASPLAKTCAKHVADAGGTNSSNRLLGSKGHPTSQWWFWGPGEWPSSETVGFTVYGQDMDFNFVGAKAFAEVLKTHGIDARAVCRLD